MQTITNKTKKIIQIGWIVLELSPDKHPKQFIFIYEIKKFRQISSFPHHLIPDFREVPELKKSSQYKGYTHIFTLWSISRTIEILLKYYLVGISQSYVIFNILFEWVEKLAGAGTETMFSIKSGKWNLFTSKGLIG